MLGSLKPNACETGSKNENKGRKSYLHISCHIFIFKAAMVWYLKAVFCIRMGFNADPAFSVNAVPDPGF
jgi:hypothetical protein